MVNVWLMALLVLSLATKVKGSLSKFDREGFADESLSTLSTMFEATKLVGNGCTCGRP